MFVVYAIGRAIAWLTLTLFWLLKGLVGLFTPPLTLWGFIIVLAISIGLAMRICRGGQMFPSLIRVWIFCLLATSFIWNATGWIVGVGSGRADFSRNREKVIETASQLVTQVNDTRAGVIETQANLTKAISAAALTANSSADAAFTGSSIASPAKLIDTVNTLIEEGRVAMELHRKLLYSIRAYSGVLPDAKLACLQAAAHQRTLAETEPYAELQDTYRAAAKYFEGYAEEIGRSADAIVQPEEVLIENARYVERAMGFLQNFRDDLQKIPEFPGPDMRAEVMRAIQEFVRDFEKLRDSLDAFGNAMPSELPPLQPPTTSTTKDSPT